MEGTSTIKKCEDCNCNCHCNVKGHSDLYGVCPCEDCQCNKKEIIVDDTDECLKNMLTFLKKEGGIIEEKKEENENIFVYTFVFRSSR